MLGLGVRVGEGFVHVVREKSSRAEVRGGAGSVGCLHSLTHGDHSFILSFIHSQNIALTSLAVKPPGSAAEWPGFESLCCFNPSSVDKSIYHPVPHFPPL